MSESQACFSLSPLFRDLDPVLLADLAGRARRVELVSGSTLFQFGDEGDALYVVATGRLRASAPQSGTEEIIGDIGRGGVVGEIALLTGEPRTATVRAIRDSVLIRIGKQDVECLLDRHPSAMMELARLIVLRLRMHGARRRRDALRSTRTLALVPAHSPAPPMAELAVDLARQLEPFGRVRILDAAAVEAELGRDHADTPFEAGERNSRLVRWLNDLEAQYRYLIYRADDRMNAWSARCLRQADRILLVADAGQSPETGECAGYLQAHGLQTPVELILLHSGDCIGPSRPLEWRARSAAMAHHHLCRGVPGDAARLTRLMTGRALGIVFGGGGARGFAHLGLIRALETAGQRVDLTGGTSIGSLISALVAQGRSPDDVRSVLSELFVKHNYLNDYSLSRVSLIGGRKFRTQLEKIFGEQRIEELPIPYFCVSTNLTRGAAVVHEQGVMREWVASSMTIPGIGPPVVWRGDLLVDGGLLNNVPTDVMQQMGRGDVIGSDVSNAVELRVEGVDSSEPRDLLNYRSVAKSFNLAKILFRSATLVDEDQVRVRRASADLYLRMPVQGVGTFDWEAAQALETQAYDYASAELERFFAAKPANDPG
jgi:NTE family protein